MALELDVSLTAAPLRGTAFARTIRDPNIEADAYVLILLLILSQHHPLVLTLSFILFFSA
jgi:hypothetical protein